MAKKNAVKDRQQTAKPAGKASKGKKEKPSLTRQERREKGKTKTAKKAAEAKLAIPIREPGGLTFAQMEASGLVARQPQPAAGPTFDQTLLEVVAEQARQFESAEPVSVPAAPDPEVRIFVNGQVYTPADYETAKEPFGSAATRKVVTEEVQRLHRLLGRTEAVSTAFCRYLYDGASTLPASLAAGDAFEEEPEDSPFRLRLAELVIGDDPAEAIGNFFEEAYGQIEKFQIIASALDPEGELEKFSRLGLIDEVTAARLKKAATEEAIRLDLAQRLAGLTASPGAPAEVDETFAALITEASQTAEAQRRERTAFRRTLSQKLRGWKEREGRRFSKSPEESGDEELIRFLLSHRSDLATMRDSLSFHLREQVKNLLKDDERKGPLRREITAAAKAANQLWAELKTRLAAGGANYPETTVTQNAAAMKDLLGALAQIRVLHERLEAPDEHKGAKGAMWINQLHLLSKRNSRGPRGMRHLLRQIRPLHPGNETTDRKDLARFLGPRDQMGNTPSAAPLAQAALA